jgi:hypothetical protein
MVDVWCAMNATAIIGAICFWYSNHSATDILTSFLQHLSNYVLRKTVHDLTPQKNALFTVFQVSK